jgi:3-oxoacyl-(acyl-carrier-protein) synthase III
MSARIPVHLAGTSSFLPGPPVTTEALARRITPPPDARLLEERTGIRARHFAEPDTSWTELATRTLRLALEAARLAPEDLARIIFVTSSAGDVLVPANANIIATNLGLRGSCDCFDLNNACMGFLTAFDLSARAIATGYGTTGIVAVELGSRYTTPEEPRPYVVFGDGAAAAVLQPSRNGEGILGSWLRNDGSLGGDVTLTHPGVTGQVERVHFNTPNKNMMQLAIDLVRNSAREVLAQAGMTLEDIDWVLPHQPNGVLLQAVIEALSLSPERVVPVVDRVGSLASASIALSLDVLMRSGRLRGGERVLMIGVGAGVSAGAILLQLP